MTEAYTSLANNLRYYGQVENGRVVRYGSQIPFNFDMITRTNKYTKAPEFKEHILSWIEGMPVAKGIMPNWVVSENPTKKNTFFNEESIVFYRKRACSFVVASN